MADTKTVYVVRDGAVENVVGLPADAVVSADGASVSWDGGGLPAVDGVSYVDQPGAQIGWVVQGGALVAPVTQASVPNAADLVAYAADKRFAVETAGIAVNGAPIATDRVSQAMIGNAYAYVQASGVASVSYKTTAGFVTLTADQVKAVALAVGAHVQACFAAERAADAGIKASPPTIATFAQVDAAFAGIA